MPGSRRGACCCSCDLCICGASVPVSGHRISNRHCKFRGKCRPRDKQLAIYQRSKRFECASVRKQVHAGKQSLVSTINLPCASHSNSALSRSTTQPNLRIFRRNSSLGGDCEYAESLPISVFARPTDYRSPT
jgi:hypothetical protein